MTTFLGDGRLQCSPGDRHPVMVRAEHHCVGDGVEEEGSCCMLAVTPYIHTFRAAVKGRWLGIPLLTVFVREFAYVTPATAGVEAPQATTDLRITIPAYIHEISTGVIRLHGREAECLAAGRAYDAELRQLLPDSFLSSVARGGDDDGGGSSSNTENLKVKECCSEEEMMNLLGSLSPRLLLRQKDVILHDVLRHEAPIPCDNPLHILRYDHVARGVPPRRLLVLRKPHGVPVHPSGRCRKNSVTAILEDVFGGIDAHRYHALPLCEPKRTDGVECMVIRHKLYDFELIRVWVGEGYVDRDAWTALHAMLLMNGPPSARLKAFVVHRLDAATSGVLVFGLDSASARMTAELLAQKSAVGADGLYGKRQTTSVTEVGCMKQYLARVHGHFDAVKLAQEQHHCASLSSSPSCCRRRGNETSCWLRVSRPIGCLSHQKSLYWCLDATQIDSWLEGEMKRGKHNTDDDDGGGELQRHDTWGETTIPSAPTERRKRPPCRSAAELQIKHERMRPQTIGKREIEAETKGSGGVEEERHVAGSPEGESRSISKKGQREEEIRRLKETMKCAVTLVRCLGYDAARDESVVECVLLTGRTHQVRVHLATLGHPICGDSKYIRHAAAAGAIGSGASSGSSLVREEEEGDNDDGESPFSRGILLHAWRYTFRYAPNNETEVLEAPPPPWATVADVSSGMSSLVDGN